MKNWLARLRVILSTLRRHKVAVTLLVLEIALTMAILSNMGFVVARNIALAHEPTGAMDRDVGIIQSIGIIGASGSGTTGSTIARLAHVPGVVAASFGASPLIGVGRFPLYAHQHARRKLADAYAFTGAQGLAQTLGVRLLAGHLPRADQLPGVSDVSASTLLPALITQALARRLYPQGDALGHTLYTSDQGGMSLRIVGIMATLRGALTGRASDDDSVLVELHFGAQHDGGTYLIRSEPGQLQRVLPLAIKAMQQANPGNVTAQVWTLDHLRAAMFSGAQAVNRMLIAIMAILLLVTALGVTGLGSYWVQQRSRHIGTRRALGATRGSILRYFQAENFLIVGAGIALGAVLSLALSEVLMLYFELPRLPLGYLGVAALALWLLGQLAVLGPALRASHAPPTVAMRAG